MTATSASGKTHVALGLGLHACQKGPSIGFTTAAALVNALLEARAGFSRNALCYSEKFSRDQRLFGVEQ